MKSLKILQPTLSKDSFAMRIAKWAGIFFIVAAALVMTMNEINAQKTEASVPNAHLPANGQFIGIVQAGQLQILWPSRSDKSVRLTKISMAAAQTPESGAFDLAEHDGKALMVRGHYAGQWIYSAEIMD
jgi:hypothetical protein